MTGSGCMRRRDVLPNVDDAQVRGVELRRGERIAIAVDRELVIAARGEEGPQQLPREAAVSSTIRETRSIDPDAHR